ncbi:MAG TPA: tetratricopeptide repeat protein, partial [Kofleriaceae bacterium]|nr:tetratricopeptide repeat protein [Kofleriaceae bacterium]
AATEPDEIADTTAPDETADTTAPDEIADTTAPDEIADTTAPDETADTTAPDETTEPDETATATTPDETADPQAQFATAYHEARRLANRGQNQAALESIDAALAINPLDARALTLKADILYARGRYAEALKYANAATSERRTYAQGWLSKGLIHLELGQPDDAKKALSRYLELRPDAPNARDVKRLIEAP